MTRLAAFDDSAGAWGPLPYHGQKDSPFYAGIEEGSIFLEDFEDGELNTPFVRSRDFPEFPDSRIVGMTYRTKWAGFDLNNSVHSVDEDDGLDGLFSGVNGDSWGSYDSQESFRSGRYIEFVFDPDDEGRLPRYVGFVVTWMDLGQALEVCARSSDDDSCAFDNIRWNLNDLRFGNRPGSTKNHRFVGFYCAAGIRRLDIVSAFQIDHLQYGYSLPEPEVPPKLDVLTITRYVDNTNIGLDRSSVYLRWSGFPEWRYAVEHSEALEGPWIEIAHVEGSGPETDYRDSDLSRVRKEIGYYRIRRTAISEAD